jgi:hypothetical protein
LVKSFKLVLRPLDEGPRPKKWQIEAKPTMAPVLEGKSIGFRPKNSAKRRAPDLENQRIRLGTKVESNSLVHVSTWMVKLEYTPGENKG